LKFVSDRPAHDRRYALDCGKLTQQLGWTPECEFESGLADTLRWYKENTQWLQETRNGEYQKYFERHYVNRNRTLAAAGRG
jgi:dTDP-glucose 4,6-dehydratase